MDRELSDCLGFVLLDTRKTWGVVLDQYVKQYLTSILEENLLPPLPPLPPPFAPPLPLCPPKRCFSTTCTLNLASTPFARIPKIGGGDGEKGEKW